MFLELDKISGLVTTDTDVSVAALERELHLEGYALNYHPLPHMDVLLADALNERWPNLYARSFGGIEDLCVQLKLARPDGKVWQNRLTPRSATGPSFKKMMMGAVEHFGVPVQAVLRLFSLPEVLRIAFFACSEARHLELFAHALKRQAVGLPLTVELVSPAHKQDLGLAAETQVLATAFWGREDQVNALTEYLAELSELKHAQYLSLPLDQSFEAWWRRLHQVAINFWKQEQKLQAKADGRAASTRPRRAKNKTTAKFSESHLQLENKIQQIN